VNTAAEFLQRQTLVIPGGQGTLLVPQSFADAAIEFRCRLQRPAADGGIGLLNGGDPGIGCHQRLEAAGGQGGGVVIGGIALVQKAGHHSLGMQVHAVADAGGVPIDRHP
jgi:hypothetical protein